MKNIEILRTTISNGWTRSNRQLLKKHIGSEEYFTLNKIYTQAIDEKIPIVPKASTIGKDIFLVLKIPVETILKGKAMGDMPTKMRQEFCTRIQKFLDYVMPIFKNTEISFKNIVNKINELNLEKIMHEDELYKIIGFKSKKESFKISDLVKKKNIGDAAKLKADKNYTSEIVDDNIRFSNEISKLYCSNPLSESEFLELNNRNILNYALKYKGESIGYYSLEVTDESINIANYVLYPEFRNSKKSMNSILTLRDEVIKISKQTGIKKITASVDANNPKLLGLYERFGFHPTNCDLLSYIDDAGKEITAGEYNLVGYVE